MELVKFIFFRAYNQQSAIPTVDSF